MSEHDDSGAATRRVYALAVFTVPSGRNSTLFRIEFAGHAAEKPHPPFRVIVRQGARVDDSGPLASRAATVPVCDGDGKVLVIGSATGLEPGQVYTLVVRDVHVPEGAGAYDPQTYHVTSVSVA